MSNYLVNVDQDHSITSVAFPDLKVFIEVEGKPAKVYGVEENEDSSEIDCAIEGRGHARFALCYIDNRRSFKQPIEAHYSLEGIRVTSSVLHDQPNFFSYPQNYRGRLVRTDQMQVDKSHIRKFEFGAVPSTDDKSQAVQEEEVINSVSTVSLSLYRCREMRSVPNPSTWGAPDINAKIEENVLDERQKKAQFAFAAGVGDLEKQKQKQPGMSWVQAIGREDSPFVKYTFTVWGRAGLEIKGYVQDEDVKPFVAPSPPPQGNNKRARSPSEPSTREEIEAQIKRLQQQLNKAPASKEKNKDSGEIRRIKAEEGEHQRPRQEEKEVPVIRKGKVLYIDFDEDEAEEEERKKD